MISKEVETLLNELHDAREHAKIWKNSATIYRQKEQETREQVENAERIVADSELKIQEFIAKLAVLISPENQSLITPSPIETKPTVDGPEYLGREEA